MNNYLKTLMLHSIKMSNWQTRRKYCTILLNKMLLLTCNLLESLKYHNQNLKELLTQLLKTVFAT